jgi:hypothetical protein
MKPTYITLEQAKCFKEKRFNELCRVFWGYDCTEEENILIEENLPSFINNRENNDLAAPEQWQALEWLRTEHCIDIYSYPALFEKNNIEQEQITREYSFAIIIKGITQSITGTNIFTTPQQSISAAIDYIIKNKL